MPNDPDPHSTGVDAKRNQAEQDQGDDARQAPESGEPLAAGRQRGHVVDQKSRKVEGVGASERGGKHPENQDWESGRQQSI
jgi:hypothetical protein